MALINDCFLRACRLEKVDYTPVWIMRQAGRYLPEYREIKKRFSIIEICKNPELCAEVISLPVDKLGVDAAIIFADIMLPLEALQIKFEIKDNIGPVIHNPVQSKADVNKLKVNNVKEFIPFIFEAIKLSKKKLKVPLIGFSGAPFTLASYIIEGKPTRKFNHTKNFMRGNTVAWHMLMKKLTNIIIDYLKEQIIAGVDAVQLFDSWVGFLTPEEYQEFVFTYSHTIFEELKKTNIPAIHFGTRTAKLLELMKKAGGNVIGVDWRIPLDKAWKRIGYDVGIQGNLDPAVMLGNTENLKKNAVNVLKRADNRLGHIFNLGHGILPDTPLRNVVELVDTVHEFTLNND